MTNTNLERQRRAAAAGPGYLGERTPASAQDREAIAVEFREAGEEPPAFLTTAQQWVERQAKLFEAGEYPDKGITVSPEDLRRMEAQFDLPVPVLIEHSSNPLELGYLTAVRAEGQELFGTIALTPEADALIQRSGATSLSLGLSPDLIEIREVSLVRNPRIASAKLFHSGFLVPLLDAQAKARELEAAGKITPAQIPFVEALLTCPRSAQFEGSMRPVQQLVLDLLERMPKLQLFGDLAPNPPPPVWLPHEEEEFYRRYFPDVSLQEIARRKA